MADKKLKRPDFILRVQKEIKRRKQAVRKIKKYKAEHHSAYMLHFD